MGIFKGLCSIGLVISAVFAVAVPSTEAALAKRDSNCDNGPGPGWAAPVLTIGDTNAAGPQCETQFGHDHSPVTGIEVWRKGDKDGGRIAGIQALTFIFKFTRVGLI